MKNYIIKSLAKVEENDIEGYAVEFTPNTITEEQHTQILEQVGNQLKCQGVGAWNDGRKAFMVFENTSDVANFKSALDDILNLMS